MKLQNLYFFQQDLSDAEGDITEIFDEVAETISACYSKNTFPAKTAIYLFTPDAGVYHSVGLWENALEHGPDFANPRDFPWTLASCPASFLARSLKAHGPNTTFIGGIENLPQIEEWIQLHAAQDLIEVAIVVHLQNNFYGLNPATGFCKGVVISIGADYEVNASFEELTQFFLKS
ncbi:hypothetical protein [Aequorivita antarctica]|uniref:Uncharacterized protein n=1 Tax=Aequorivita antarctica TaxID=153266 RepID=A0A5C6YVE0_9FLAO|nr:hypothetical protein [Aequorivita antarctica]TXD71316.1 hypothetical protein ESU54_17330 [Aequorivita antarctica]SRX76205.1 hypothetical protein AEQU3_03204 [Aequorivita antarctica]